VTREAFQIEAPDVTTLGLLAPLRDQVAAQGFRILLDCETEGCGGFDFRAAIDVLPPPAMFVDLADFRYLSAEKDGEGLSLLVSRSDDRGFLQIVRVAPAGAVPEPTPDVPAPAPEDPPEDPPASGGDLAARLESEGRVVLDGLAFASGSAQLAPGGDAALASLAAYLAENPTRRVAIVGHTDAQGALDANVALSRRRAQAVADRLVEDHGVRRAQLEAHGMGWLAPLATNLTAEGARRTGGSRRWSCPEPGRRGAVPRPARGRGRADAGTGLRRGRPPPPAWATGQGWRSGAGGGRRRQASGGSDAGRARRASPPWDPGVPRPQAGPLQLTVWKLPLSAFWIVMSKPASVPSASPLATVLTMVPAAEMPPSGPSQVIVGPSIR
jgi:OOP family OmpA-OmpF porin